MRRSFSRGRRPVAKVEPGLISHAMPRLLTEHDDDNTTLPPTFPRSPKSRRRLRAQLFGLDNILQAEAGKDQPNVPVDRGRALAGGHSPQVSLDEQSAKAIALLRELNKTASIVDSVELAPPTEQPPSVSPSSSTERSLSRRRSLYKPGEATRPKSSHATPASHHVDTKVPSVPKNHDRRDHLETPARPRMQRAVTPGDFDNLSLGTHELGSLRITNDQAPAPPARHSDNLSPSTMVKQSRAPDYFAGAQPEPADTTPQSHDLDIEAVQSQTLLKAGDRITAAGTEDDSPFSSSSNEGLQVDQPLGNKRSSKRGSVLVGHRRHAQQRANTIGFSYEQGNSPYSVSSLESADDARTALGNASSNTLNISNFAHPQLSPLSAVSDMHYQLLSEKPSDASTNISTHSPAPSNALLSMAGSSNDSAYGSRASVEVSDSDRARAAYIADYNVARPDSPTSVYSVQDDTASAIMHDIPPPDGKTHLQIPAPQTLRSSGSFLSESSRDSNTGPRPPSSAGSTQASSRQSRSPTRPNKLQKRRPSPEKPTPADDIVVQGHQPPVAGVPDPTSTLLSAHATRMDNNPGMDHLTETHSPNTKRSVSAESATIPPASLLFRFPSPTPSLEVDARDQKSFFRSMSRSRKRTGTNVKEKPKPIHITREDLGDVLGVLGSSPYDCASPPRTRTTSAQQKLNKQPVLHPHQIRGPAVINTRGMSAEDAAALAMRRSRDRVVNAAELIDHKPRQQRTSTSISPQRRTEKPRAAQPPPSPFPSVDGEASFTRQGRPQSPQRQAVKLETLRRRSTAAMPMELPTEEQIPRQESRAVPLPAVEAGASNTVTRALSASATDAIPPPQGIHTPVITSPAPLPTPTPTPSTSTPHQMPSLPKPASKPAPTSNVYQPPASWACPPATSALRPAQASTQRPTTSKSSSWKPWKKPEVVTPAIMPFQPLVLNLPTPTPSRSPSPLPENAAAKATVEAAATLSQAPSTFPTPIPTSISDIQSPPPPPPHAIPLPSKLIKPSPNTTSALPRPPSRAHSFLKRPYSSRKSKKRPGLPEVPPQLPALSLDFGAGFEGLEDGAWV